MQNKKTLSEILIDNECPVGFEVDCDLFNNHACLVGVTYDEIVIKSAAQELKDKEQHQLYSIMKVVYLAFSMVDVLFLQSERKRLGENSDTGSAIQLWLLCAAIHVIL